MERADGMKKDDRVYPDTETFIPFAPRRSAQLQQFGTE